MFIRCTHEVGTHLQTTPTRGSGSGALSPIFGPGVSYSITQLELAWTDTVRTPNHSSLALALRVNKTGDCLFNMVSTKAFCISFVVAQKILDNVFLAVT